MNKGILGIARITSDGEALVLENWRMQISSSLTLLPSPLRPGEYVHIRVFYMVQINMFKKFSNFVGTQAKKIKKIFHKKVHMEQKLKRFCNMKT